MTARSPASEAVGAIAGLLGGDAAAVADLRRFLLTPSVSILVPGCLWEPSVLDIVGDNCSDIAREESKDAYTTEVVALLASVPPRLGPTVQTAAKEDVEKDVDHQASGAERIVNICINSILEHHAPRPLLRNLAELLDQPDQRVVVAALRIFAEGGAGGEDVGKELFRPPNLSTTLRLCFHLASSPVSSPFLVRDASCCAAAVLAKFGAPEGVGVGDFLGEVVMALGRKEDTPSESEGLRASHIERLLFLRLLLRSPNVPTRLATASSVLKPRGLKAILSGVTNDFDEALLRKGSISPVMDETFALVLEAFQLVETVPTPGVSTIEIDRATKRTVHWAVSSLTNVASQLTTEDLLAAEAVEQLQCAAGKIAKFAAIAGGKIGGWRSDVPIETHDAASAIHGAATSSNVSASSKSSSSTSSNASSVSAISLGLLIASISTAAEHAAETSTPWVPHACIAVHVVSGGSKEVVEALCRQPLPKYVVAASSTVSSFSLVGDWEASYGELSARVIKSIMHEDCINAEQVAVGWVPWRTSESLCMSVRDVVEGIRVIIRNPREHAGVTEGANHSIAASPEALATLERRLVGIITASTEQLRLRDDLCVARISSLEARHREDVRISRAREEEAVKASQGAKRELERWKAKAESSERGAADARADLKSEQRKWSTVVADAQKREEQWKKKFEASEADAGAKAQR
ncbi:hypothetical protein HDU93_008477 [Gonapodya sp. JEL0774]|nr:hypothetical protein HDU93_008477 [Gonapodya sp. JEL0774]